MMIMKKREAAGDLRPYIDIPTHAMPALEPGLMLDILTGCFFFTGPPPEKDALDTPNLT